MNARTERDADRLVLYTRAGCHLCEEAEELLDAAVGRAGYERRDIDAHDELLVRYAHRVPVIALDGVDRLEGVITGPELREIVSQQR